MSADRVEDFDVVVVGAGAAGLTAAIEAHDRGAEVVVLQKLPEAGGKSWLAIGSIAAAGTALQTAHGISDDPARYLADLESRVDIAALPAQSRLKLRAVVAGSGAAVDRLAELGVTFSGPHPETPGEPARLHVLAPDVRTLVTTLARRARDRGIRIRVDWPADRLLTDPDGAVSGVDGPLGTTLARHGVVLASGDFSAPPRLGGPAPAGSQYAFRPWSTGDGQVMAAAVGAAVSGLDDPIAPQWRTLDWPHIGIDPAVFAAGAVVVDRSGGQVCDERGDIGAQLAASGAGDTYLIFDRRVLNLVATAADDSPGVRDGWLHTGLLHLGTFPGVGYAYVDDLVGAGYAHVTGSVPELAARFGIDPAGLAAGLARRGVDRPPYFGSGPFQARSLLGVSGVDVDEGTRVLRPDGTPIPRLYAAGAVAGPTSYGQGHGFGLAWAVVSGRIAGAAVAANEPALAGQESG